MVFKLYLASKPLGGLKKIDSGALPWESDSVGLEQDLRIFIPKMFPGDAAAASSGTTLWEPLISLILPKPGWKPASPEEVCQKYKFLGFLARYSDSAHKGLGLVICLFNKAFKCFWDFQKCHFLESIGVTTSSEVWFLLNIQILSSLFIE